MEAKITKGERQFTIPLSALELFTGIPGFSKFADDFLDEICKALNTVLQRQEQRTVKPEEKCSFREFRETEFSSCVVLSHLFFKNKVSLGKIPNRNICFVVGYNILGENDTHITLVGKPVSIRHHTKKYFPSFDERNYQHWGLPDWKLPPKGTPRESKKRFYEEDKDGDHPPRGHPDLRNLIPREEHYPREIPRPIPRPIPRGEYYPREIPREIPREHFPQPPPGYIPIEVFQHYLGTQQPRNY